jgi:chromosome segregation ATPase
MNENDYKTLIITYQQKSFDLFSQVIALEAKLSTSNQFIESLMKQLNDLNSELESLKSKNKKTSTKISDSLNSGEF